MFRSASTPSGWWVAMVLLAALAVGCKGEPTTESKTAEVDAAAKPVASSEPAQDALLTRLAGAGFQIDESVPFDDEGTLPESLTSGKAAGWVRSDEWVLRQNASYIQLFCVTFASPSEAETAKSSLVFDDDVLVDGVRLFVLMPFPGAESLKSSLAAVLPTP